jgi:citrate/tricarballylate utilization protein
VATALGLVAGLTLLMLVATWAMNPEGLRQPSGDFYAVVPHGVMVSLFGGVGIFVLVALGVGLRGFWREVQPSPASATAGPDGRFGATRWSVADIRQALVDALTLRHLHTTGVDCTTAEDTRRPWRRWFHHCTMYGFLLCFASTSVAAVYHTVFGWHAPYAYTSLPVLLGTTGGVGLLVGPAGLLAIRRQRDPDLGDPDQQGLDVSFIVPLWLTSLTGLVLLVLRDREAMGVLLVIHLGAVLALFLTLPYGKFVHGIYRTAALVKYAVESRS